MTNPMPAAPSIGPDFIDRVLASMGRDPESVDLGPIDKAGAHVLLSSLEHSAALTPRGRSATRRYLTRLVQMAAGMGDYVAADPEVRNEPITAPIFVLGPPRSGTTVLHRLLAEMSGNRAPLAWELLAPVPPPEAETHASDPRIDAVGDELTYPQRVAGQLEKIHTYSATMPKECLSAMALAWCSEEFVSRYHVPDYATHYDNHSRRPGYDMHRRVLQLLQRRMPTERWVLKSPVHLHAIPDLVATYPDARFVVTHRHPGEFLASVSSLISTLRSAFSDTVDRQAIGRAHLERYTTSLDALVDAVADGVLPAERTVHVHHRDVVADAVGQVERVASALGLGIDADDLVRIRALHRRDRTDGVGAHRYDPADFGLADIDHDGRFGRYLDHFAVR